jgi:hypothetical protein
MRAGGHRAGEVCTARFRVRSTPYIRLVQDPLMRDLFRGLIAGAAAWKLGGGCISTILIFVLIYWLLGKF